MKPEIVTGEDGKGCERSLSTPLREAQPTPTFTFYTLRYNCKKDDQKLICSWTSRYPKQHVNDGRGCFVQDDRGGCHLR